MSRMLACVAFGLALLVAPAAFAGERTITLAVQNMYCADVPSWSERAWKRCQASLVLWSPTRIRPPS